MTWRLDIMRAAFEAAVPRSRLPCRKVTHKSRAAAEAHLRALRARGRREQGLREPETLDAYCCHRCGMYHIGHRKETREI